MVTKNLLPRVIETVKNSRGFMRADTLFSTLFSKEPSVEQLHDFIDTLDDYETATKTMLENGMISDGLATVSWRRKTDIPGLDDKNFPKAELPKDTRPPQKRRKPKLDKDGNVIVKETKETKDWIPGVAIVTSDYFQRDVLAAELRADMSELFASIDTTNVGCEFLTNHLFVSAKEDSNGGGTYVTLLLRNV